MREELREHGWSPNDQKSPFSVWHMILPEEWVVISKSYPYSMRVLVKIHNETRWSEHGRTQTKEQAEALMSGLARLYSTKPWWINWIVMVSTCTGSQVQEKPILWYPSQEHILKVLQKGGLLPGSDKPARRKRP